MCPVLREIDKIIIPSSIENINVIEEYIENLRHEYQIEDNVYGNMLLAVVEALTIAIVHGNQNDISKKVTFTTYKSASDLKFCICDQGKGFRAESVPDPTLDENRCKLGGRGVFLIQQLSDHVIYSNNGTMVEIVFHLS